MDIDKVNFPARLLDMLTAVSESHFVSFDLELSGVPVKQGGGKPGKASLQERYLEIKKAAEQYQILQIGITCVTEDSTTGTYECKPFNINLSPVVEERLGIERNFSFHSGAVEFLLGVGFQFEMPFTWGVPYLSRNEAKLAKEKSNARQDRAAFPDMQIKTEDTEAHELMRKVRAEIDQWKNKGMRTNLYLGPAEISDAARGQMSDELSRFERRLVHQLVRAEYPDLVSISKRGIIQILEYDQEREDDIKEKRKRENKERIGRLTGFRWVLEAMAGSSLHDIDIRSFARDPQTGEQIFVDLHDLRARFQRAHNFVKNQPRVLFGHNLFLDIIYLYRTFFGDLPDTVEEFQALIHGLFPMIVDTKYMATHNCGDINPMSSLQQIDEQLLKQETPVLATHEKHGKYEETTAFHEAGYDSMLTAHIAVRLSAKLEAQGSYIEDMGQPAGAEEQITPVDEGGGVKLNGGAQTFTPGGSSKTTPKATALSSTISGLKDLVLAPVKAITQSGTAPPAPATSNIENKSLTQNSASEKSSARGKAKKNKNEVHTVSTSITSGGRFAHGNAFQSLSDATTEDDGEDAVLQFEDLPSSTGPVVSNTDGQIDAEEARGYAAPVDSLGGPQKREPMQLMPRFDSDFWKVYGNKLRVFGTQEGVCILDSL